MRLHAGRKRYRRRRAPMERKDDSGRQPRGETRRSFIRQTAAAGAVVATSTSLFGRSASAQNKAPFPGRVIGANDRIAVAYIGTGNQGGTHVKSQKQFAAENNIVQAGVCDIFQKR